MQHAATVVYYQFAGFQFDPERDELCLLPAAEPVKLEPVKLEPKVAQLLGCFLSQPQQVLSQEYLQQQLWPDTIVEQNSLYQLLTKLRRLLNDPSRQPRFIRTVPKKGYSWLAPVSVTHVNAAQASAAKLCNSAQQPASAPTDTTASQTTPIPALLIDQQGTPPVKPLRQLVRRHWWALALPAVILGFSAVASFQRDQQSVPRQYQVQDISYALGLEFEADAHPRDNLLVYIKDIFTLQITDKQGQPLYQQRFASRIAKPAWHESQKMLAFWRYQGDSCELQVMSAQGAVSHIATPVKCQDVQKPLWISAEELILSVRQGQQYQPYLYRLSTREWVPVPLPKRADLQYYSAIKAWGGQVYYLMRDPSYRSQLIDLKGNTQMQWPYPIWLLAYDATTDTLLSNDYDKRSALVAWQQDGKRYNVFQTAQGLFTSLSIDQQGDIYSTVESWQVNIRDKHNQPLFSTSSIDYLPVSNPLGETAFMSRRSGVCEVYLHSENQVLQLSHAQSYSYVNFLEWRPDWSMLLSNRDNDLVLYDRQNTLLQFASGASGPLRSLGWLDNQTVFAFDGDSVRLYNLQGRQLSEQRLQADNLTFDHSRQRWLLRRAQAWYQLPAVALSQPAATQTPTLLLSLQPEQAHNMHNIRIRGDQLYWQSDWSKQDFIWSMPLQGKPAVSLRTSGQLIWHFDVTPFQELTIAKMEATEGDIKKLSLVSAEH